VYKKLFLYRLDYEERNRKKEEKERAAYAAFMKQKDAEVQPN